MVLGSVFLLNLLCAMVPCPQIRESPTAFLDKNKLEEDVRIFGTNISHPIVQTKSGIIQGYSMGSRNGSRFYAFEGIRYAKPPIDILRFKSPVPAEPWNGIYPAFKYKENCLQIHPLQVFRVVGHEDCLFLNIYTKKPYLNENSSNAMETIIWMHGGAFMLGSASEYGPAYMLDHDVILVTINYRLGVLGFMSTGDSASTGNYGLKDQRLAIKWVYDNIKSFGGSPEKINLMGQSAGGVSVNLHMMNEESVKYFKSGISLSGSSFIHWGITSSSKGRRWTNKIARLVNCQKYEEDSYALVDCLRNTSPYLLVGAQLQAFEFLPFPPVIFGPVIESKNATDTFITESPEELYSKGKVAKIPWLSNLMKEEGALSIYFLKSLLKFNKVVRDYNKFFPIIFDYYELSSSDRVRITKKIKEFYLNGVEPFRIQEDLLRPIIMDITSDRYFYYGILKAIRAHSQIASTYSYIFGFQGKHNLGRTTGQAEDVWGIGHTEDAFYFFNSSFFIDAIKETDYAEFELSKLIIDLVVNFVRGGEPLHTNNDGTLIQFWDKIDKNKQNFNMLQIEKDIKMVDFPFIKRLKFWESLNIEDVQPLKYLNFTI